MVNHNTQFIKMLNLDQRQAMIIIIIIIIRDQTGHPTKSPRTIRLRRVPRGQSKIIRKTRTKTKEKKHQKL